MTRAFLEENLASPDRGRSVLTVKVPERKPHSAPGRDTVFCRNSTTCRMPKEPSTTAHNWSVASMLAGHAISSWSFTMGLSEQRNTTCEKRRTTTARRTLPSPLVFSCKLLHLTLLLTVLLVDIPLGSSAQQRDNKTPLISTQANSSSEFRELFGVPLGRSTTDNRADADTLDFQTMKYIKEWGNTTDILLVIGKNHIYMMDSNKPHNSLNHFRERLTWETSVKSQRECVLMGKKKYECRNYIRVAEVMQNGELMVCGTNAYSPTCRYYKREQFNEPKPGDDSIHQSETPCRDQCIVPYNPATASATLYTETANGFHVFTAVLNDFLSNDPIIFKRGTTSLYTNPMWLNDPTFLKMVEYDDKVYVFFREIAKESESGTTEKVTYARVAQICKDDEGGVNVLAKQWTSFLKARLLCGYPGRQHLQFNNMTSVSDIVTIEDENGEISDAVIASFTTPWQWTDASLSAVCVFAMKDIISLFETGSFSGEYVLDAKPKEKPEMPSMGRPSFAARASIKKITRSYPVPEIETPEKRPGRCGASLDAKYDPSVLSFAKEHPLMYDAVNPFFGGPVFVTYNNVRATQITVDEIGISGSNYTMIYLGTENGEVMRLRAMFSQQGPKAVLIETTTTGGACTGDNCSIRSMYVSRPAPDTNSEPSLFVAFSHNVVQFPISRCHQYSNERCCSVDPDCGWTGEGCVPRTSQKSSSLQPINHDISRLPTTCQTSTHVSTVGSFAGFTEETTVLTRKLDPHLGGKVNQSFPTTVPPMATAQTGGGIIALAYFVGFLTALIIVVVIFCIQRKCQKKKYDDRGSKLKISEVEEKSNYQKKSNRRDQTVVTEDKYHFPPSPSPSVEILTNVDDVTVRQVHTIHAGNIPSETAQINSKYGAEFKTDELDATEGLIRGNPNFNNSNNTQDECSTSPPALPAKLSSLKRDAAPLNPRPPSSDVQNETTITPLLTSSPKGNNTGIQESYGKVTQPLVTEDKRQVKAPTNSTQFPDKNQWPVKTSEREVNEDGENLNCLDIDKEIIVHLQKPPPYREKAKSSLQNGAENKTWMTPAGTGAPSPRQQCPYKDTRPVESSPGTTKLDLPPASPLHQNTGPRIPVKRINTVTAYDRSKNSQPTTHIPTSPLRYPIVGSHRQCSPIKKHLSFSGVDRQNKPPIPVKSQRVRDALSLRPHSLAPPTSITNLEDIRLPLYQFSSTPPTSRVH